jgi:transcriptional regulator with XRE-family HTH domain
MSYFGNKLKLVIRNSGMKQVDVCRELGISQSRLSSYVVGTREPDFELICKIASYFGKPISYFSEHYSKMKTYEYVSDREKIFTALRLMAARNQNRTIIEGLIELLEQHLCNKGADDETNA